MTHAGHAWAPTGTPGRCLEGVTPGSAGIFSALSYFVAETRALVGGGARGAIAPPTFLDLLNRYQFLPKNSNFTSTPNF